MTQPVVPPRAIPDASDWRWDDARVVLVLARQRQVTRAASQLGVDPATISRRLAAIEAAIGAPLFVRTGRALAITERGEALVPVLEDIERSMAAVFAEAERHDRDATGVVRVTTPPLMCEHLLIPRVAALRARAPGITLELDGESRVVDLAGREADLALRVVASRGAGLVERRVATMRLTIAVAPALRARAGVVAAWAELPWIGLDSLTDSFVRVRAASYAVRARSPEVQAAAVREGLGAALMPAVLAAQLGLVEPALAPALRAELAAVPPMPVWLVTRQAIRRSARIRAVWDWLAACGRELGG